MKIFLTGKPGCGKSTLLLKVIENLKANGMKVGGIVTPENRVGNRRIGFHVKDIFTGKEGILASIENNAIYRIGKYGINIKDFERVALPALDFALKECDVICIDEIGKMEWFSINFRNKIYEIIKSDKKVIGVVHRNFVNMFKDYGIVLEVNPENRENLPKEIIRKIIGGSAQN